MRKGTARSSSVTEPWKPRSRNSSGRIRTESTTATVVEHDDEDVPDALHHVWPYRPEPAGVDQLVPGPHPGPVAQAGAPPVHDLLPTGMRREVQLRATRLAADMPYAGQQVPLHGEVDPVREGHVDHAVVGGHWMVVPAGIRAASEDS